MSRSFTFVYFMADRPDEIRRVAPRHAAYWRGLELDGYVGGPFADRTGGLITFLAEEQSQAKAAVAGDPFVVEGLLERSWLKEWAPGRPPDPARRITLDATHA